MIILISDGEDIHRRKFLNDSQQSAIANDAVIFLSLNTNDVAWGYPKGDPYFSRAPGGNIFPARQQTELRRVFSEVEKRVFAPGTPLGYTPADFAPMEVFIPYKSSRANPIFRGVPAWILHSEE